MNKELLLEQISKQKENLVNSPLKDYKYRVKLLKKLRENIKLMQSEICEALKKDLNKSEVESYMCEIGIVLSEISYMIKHIRYFASPKLVKTPIAQFPSKSYKVPCAYGQVLIISPWNYPFMLTMDPLVDALSAGNSIVVKPSETSHNVSVVIEKIIKATFKPEEVCVAMGGRQECEFLLDQDFDYIFFTGSTRVGKIVLQKASEHFTPVTLELGGKSPCIVDKTANIKVAAKRIVFGKFLNAGQTCVAPDYLYCDKEIKDELVKEIQRQIELQYTSDPVANENYPRIINEKHFERLSNLIDKEKLICGGKTNKSTLQVEPTLVNATFEDDTMKEEIFGPILPVITFNSIDEAIKNVNNLSKPLAFYIFSNSKKNQEKLQNSCDFGGGCINDTIIHLATSELGFGGVKQSGMGAYHGKVGFDTFTHYKSIVKKGTWLDLPMRYQPFNKIKTFLIKMFLK